MGLPDPDLSMWLNVAIKIMIAAFVILTWFHLSGGPK